MILNKNMVFVGRGRKEPHRVGKKWVNIGPGKLPIRSANIAPFMRPEIFHQKVRQIRWPQRLSTVFVEFLNFGEQGI